ncbi:hypothetical protein M427DRAFT_335169 [Gonapodya prolifera JEL478]|uniref:Rhodanese domain-containing protein n=1 Tax=Gonapodya prolifera (strain JEL478) TaxID=1344416 RepID=A0A139ADJ9_GONPJ|nr:hypothetical protein M427DRAFT_335169 [Gonapodya prolifera JEL478]|eukprot:KXS14847.1 hypothetical protein M427DRAFT_335169 [Gonapodya prolifera JEL478]
MLSPLLPSGIPGLYSTASVHDLRQFIDSSPWTNPSASDPKSQKVLILDVREPSELSLLPAIDTPATIAVPMSSFRHDALRLIRRKVDELRRVHGDSASENSPTTLKDVHVHIMCASGTRAVKAAVALGWEGLFGDVSVVTGGMQSWGRMAPETKAATSRRRAE